MGHAQSKIDLSILIASYNGKQMLADLIDSIKKAAVSLPYEIVVMDDNSSDGTSEHIRARYPEITLVRNERNKGYCGLNGMVAHCKGPALCLLNNDMLVENDIFTPLYNYLNSHPDVGLAVPMVVSSRNREIASAGSWVSRAFYADSDLDFKMHTNGSTDLREIPYYGVGMIRKDTIAELGFLFDEDYFLLAEDVDLGLRLRLRGLRTVYLKELKLYHIGRSSRAAPSRHAYYVFLCERNLQATFVKIPSALNLFVLFPYVVFARVMAITRDLALCRFRVAWARIRAMLSTVANLKALLGKRADVQRRRRAPDTFVFDIFREKFLFKRLMSNRWA
jgi:GT2 family glycosyltransferase